MNRKLLTMLLGLGALVPAYANASCLIDENAFWTDGADVILLQSPCNDVLDPLNDIPPEPFITRHSDYGISAYTDVKDPNGKILSVFENNFILYNAPENGVREVLIFDNKFNLIETQYHRSFDPLSQPGLFEEVVKLLN